ncbi:MAG: hypothetical protein RHS_4161 [Robinsoniella sp. RHS]|nr:MAG: hypothetical protein RHS_4161 [Robinsoniella sp. RHS]
MKKERREGYEVWKKEVDMGTSCNYYSSHDVLNRSIGKVSENC